MVGHGADRHDLDRVARLLEEERRLAVRVRSHLARMGRVVAAYAIDAAHRKDFVRPHDRIEVAATAKGMRPLPVAAPVAAQPARPAAAAAAVP
jgi:hypothetical protein